MIESGAWRALVIVFVLLLLTTPRIASAAESSRELVWKESWPTFRPAEYVVTAAAGTASLLAFFALPLHEQPQWTGGILFDDAARDALRVRSPAARDRVRTVSDVTAVSVAAWVAVDSLLVPLAERSGSVAYQLMLMDAEAFALSTVVTTTMYKTIGRGRPSYADCAKDPAFDPLCNSGPTASFPSGHTNAAFTAAGLSCAHHLHLQLYGGGFADELACGGTIALASATAALRVMGDRHYASDVLVGAAIGFGTGFAVPTLLHYTTTSAAAAMSIAPTPTGLVIAGVF